MPEIPLTQGKFAIVDDVDYEFLMQFKWCAINPGGAWRPMRKSKQYGTWRNLYMYHVIMARMGIFDFDCVDHIDRNPLNNRRSNLRPATKSQNGHNCGLRRDNTTGIKGVSYSKRDKVFQGKTKIEGQEVYCGSFDNAAEAGAAVKARRKELMGEFADA